MFEKVFGLNLNFEFKFKSAERKFQKWFLFPPGGPINFGPCLLTAQPTSPFIFDFLFLLHAQPTLTFGRGLAHELGRLPPVTKPSPLPKVTSPPVSMLASDSSTARNQCVVASSVPLTEMARLWQFPSRNRRNQGQSRSTAGPHHFPSLTTRLAAPAI
jgi:hypothetical protein